MSVAILFPGQGSQSADMLPWLEHDENARPALRSMEAEVGADWRARSHDGHWLSDNSVAQCLVTGINLAVWHALLGAGLSRVSATAGYSVGEVSALGAAGVYDLEEALRLSRLRAIAMNRSARGSRGGLLSVSGRHSDELMPEVRRLGLEMAIDIGPDRFLLGGPRDALDAIGQTLEAAGAAIRHLDIEVASHTSYMREASVEFAADLAPSTWSAPRFAVVTNYTGGLVSRPGELKNSLSEQISHTVLWGRCMRTLGERRPACVLEVGAGTALSKQWNAAIPDIQARSAEEFRTAASAVAWVCSRM